MTTTINTNCSVPVSTTGGVYRGATRSSPPRQVCLNDTCWLLVVFILQSTDQNIKLHGLNHFGTLLISEYLLVISLLNQHDSV